MASVSVSSAPETAPVESSENASSSSLQQSSLSAVSTPPNVSSCKYPKRARKAPGRYEPELYVVIVCFVHV